EVCTRELLCYGMMDPNSILGVTSDDGASLDVFVVDCQFRNLERSAMRITNESYLVSIVIIRSIDLIRPHAVHRKNDVSCLVWHLRSFQMHCSSICGVSEVVKKLLANYGICQSHDLI